MKQLRTSISYRSALLLYVRMIKFPHTAKILQYSEQLFVQVSCVTLQVIPSDEKSFFKLLLRKFAVDLRARSMGDINLQHESVPKFQFISRFTMCHAP